MNRWPAVAFEDIVIPGSAGLKRGPFGGAIKKDIFVSDGYKFTNNGMRYMAISAPERITLMKPNSKN
jgi:hypothetical protein